MSANAINVDLDAQRVTAQQAVRNLRQKKCSLDGESLDLILRVARSHYAWDQSRPVTRELLEVVYEATASGPTSMNCCPARFYFIESDAARERLSSALKPKNIDKMMSAPVTVIVAYDLDFWRKLPYLFPHEDRRPLFEGKHLYSEETAFRNSTLQGAYFMIAARAVGLDVGAMSGFNNAVVDAEFFDGQSLKSNFIINIGYADESALFQKLPRFAFDDVCHFI